MMKEIKRSTRAVKRSTKAEKIVARDRVDKLFKAGLSLDEIGKETGYGMSRVRRYLKECGKSYISPQLDEDTKALIVKAYKEGKSILAINTKYPKLSYYRIYQAVVDAGYTPKKGISDSKIAEIKKCYEDGMSINKASKTVGSTRRTVSKYFKKFKTDNKEVDQ